MIIFEKIFNLFVCRMSKWKKENLIHFQIIALNEMPILAPCRPSTPHTHSGLPHLTANSRPARGL